MQSARRTIGIVFVLLLLAACGPTPTALPGPDSATPPATPFPPTAKVQPSAGLTTEPTAAPVVPTPPPIAIDAPRPGAEVGSPLEVRGVVAVVPFESTLLVRVYDADGRIIGQGPIMVQGAMGDVGPKPFSGQIAFSAPKAGRGKVEVVELSPKDGTVLHRATVEVTLRPSATTAGVIETPATDGQATLPLHIMARLGRPGEQVVAALLWQDGSVLTRTYTLLEGEDGRGLLVESLWWQADVPPLPFPPTQPATLEIRALDGTVLARQELTVISWDDARNIQQVTVYFLLGEELQPITVNVPRTPRIGSAALEALLWGPPPPNLAGLGTALPLPPQVLRYPGRAPDWGPRVRLIDLTIENGVAVANFSKELRAYGGGSTRVMLIYQQISRTLKEFPTVKEVVIAIEGETEGVLEP